MGTNWFGRGKMACSRTKPETEVSPHGGHGHEVQGGGHPVRLLPE